MIDFSGLSEFYGKDVIITANNVSAFEDVVRRFFEKEDSVRRIINEASANYLSRGVEAAVHVYLDANGAPEWIGWSCAKFYEPYGHPSIPYLAVSSAHSEEPPISCTEDDLLGLLSGL